MTRTEIADGVAALLEEIAGVKASEVADDKNLTEYMGIDSLTLVELVIAAEHRFGIRITDDQMQRFETVGDLVGQIDKALNAVKA